MQFKSLYLQFLAHPPTNESMRRPLQYITGTYIIYQRTLILNQIFFSSQ